MFRPMHNFPWMLCEIPTFFVGHIYIIIFDILVFVVYIFYFSLLVCYLFSRTDSPNGIIPDGNPQAEFSKGNDKIHQIFTQIKCFQLVCEVGGEGSNNGHVQEMCRRQKGDSCNGQGTDMQRGRVD